MRQTVEGNVTSEREKDFEHNKSTKSKYMNKNLVSQVLCGNFHILITMYGFFGLDEETITRSLNSQDWPDLWWWNNNIQFYTEQISVTLLLTSFQINLYVHSIYRENGTSKNRLGRGLTEVRVGWALRLCHSRGSQRWGRGKGSDLFCHRLETTSSVSSPPGLYLQSTFTHTDTQTKTQPSFTGQ